MTFPSPVQLGMRLAWRFNEVLPQTFERDRKEVLGIQFPIVAPLPSNGVPTQPIEGPLIPGPFLYALYGGSGSIEYFGVAVQEGLTSPLDRWTRPDKERTRDYWAHGTNKKTGAVVVRMAEGISSGHGPYSLYYTNYEHVFSKLRNRAASLAVHFAAFEAMEPRELIEELEHALIYSLQSPWNVSKRRKPPKSGILRIADYWTP